MKTQLQVLFFLSLFCFLCTAFVFFVPWGSSQDESDEQVDQIEQNEVNAVVNNDEVEQVKFSWTLRIALKSWMLTDGLKSYLDYFKDTYWGNIEVVEVESPDEWQTLKWVDLYLFPYDQIAWMNFSPINFQEDIVSIFIPQLRDFVSNHKDIIPFWIDVPVVYGLSDLSNWMDSLVSNAQNWKPARPHGPFNFWISDNISTYDNSLISSHQIIDFMEVNDIWAFSQWIDFSTPSQELQQWLLSSIQWNSDICKKYPLDCLMEKNLLWIAWWFHSDYDQGFEWKFEEWKYPYEWESQFVRLYGLAVDENSENESMAFQFILDYMDFAFIDLSSSLSKSMWLVPVFQNEYSKNCYQDACDLESKISILEDGFSSIKRFYEDNIFRRVVSKKIQPNLYLTNTSI